MGGFFKNNQLMFARVGGILVVMFGLYQLGFFGSSSLLGRERRLPFKLDTLAMSPFTALVMGFTFSFAWTPCVGPVSYTHLDVYKRQTVWNLCWLTGGN